MTRDCRILIWLLISTFCVPAYGIEGQRSAVLAITPQDEYLWLGTRDGLVRFDTTSETWDAFMPPQDESSFYPEIIVSIAVRHEGGVYVASAYEGILTFIDEQWARIEGFEENAFRKVCYGPHGKLWVLGSVFLYEYREKSWIVHDIRGVWGGGSSSSNSSLSFESDGSAWVSGGWGISRVYDGQIGYIDTEWTQSQYLTVDQEDRIWIARKDTLLITDGVEWQRYEPDDTGIAGKTIYTLAIDNDGTLWAGGVHWFGSFDGHTWAVYDSTEYGLLGETGIYDLYFDEDDILWLGTSDGLIKFDGTTWTHYDLETGTIDTAVETSATPSAIELHHASPNPFNPSTTIAFTLPEADTVRLSVITVNGQEVAILEDNFLAPGTHTVVFDGSGLSSGVYFYRLESSETAATGKMLLLK